MPDPKKAFGLPDLVGRTVTAVCFVADYVDLTFDGPILRALTEPKVFQKHGGVLRFPNPGSRDALCSLIGRTAVSVTEDASEIRVNFDSGENFSIPLDMPSRVGPEAAHFVPEIGGPIQVW